MRLVAFADVHLGFRQFDRVTSRGVNQREADIEDTFARAVDRVIELTPDVVVVAGDLVDSPRPSPNAVLALQDGFARLAKHIPAVVVAAGNHDVSKTVGERCILRSLVPFGVHVADREAVRFFFEGMSLSVLAVPDAPGLARPLLIPDERAITNVLVCHGEVQGVTQGNAERHATANEITRGELDPSLWTFCAFGHYHQFEQLASNSAYSGSLDYASHNIWQEVATPKGVIMRDLGTGEQTFERIAPTRRVLDLPMIDATGLGSADLQAAIVRALDEADIENAVVRLRIAGHSREVWHGIDAKVLRSYSRRATSLHFDERRADRVSAATIAAVREINRRSLTERVTDSIATREIPNDVDRETLQRKALEYLEAAGETEAAKDPRAVSELASLLASSLSGEAA